MVRNLCTKIYDSIVNDFIGTNNNGDDNGSSDTSSISSSSSTNNSNAGCRISAPLNANSSGLKVNVLPPKIVVNYAGVEYRGELSEAKYRAGISFPELHIRPQNISSNLPSNIVYVKKDSCIQFLIVGSSKLLPPRRTGRITRQGNKRIRWFLAEGAQMAARFDPKMRSFYERISRKKGHQKALITVARKRPISSILLKMEKAFADEITAFYYINLSDYNMQIDSICKYYHFSETDESKLPDCTPKQCLSSILQEDPQIKEWFSKWMQDLVSYQEEVL